MQILIMGEPWIREGRWAMKRENLLKLGNFHVLNGLSLVKGRLTNIGSVPETECEEISRN